MPNLTCVTPGCDQPTTDGRICWTCTNHLLADLRHAPELVRELETTTTKQDRMEEPTRRTATIPLPFRPAASEVAWVHRATLRLWAGHVARHAGTTTPTRPDHPQRPRIDDRGALVEHHGDTRTVAVARWLVEHVDIIRQHPDAGTIVDEIGFATDRARIAIDRPPVLVYLGPCTCSPDARGRPVEIYARPHSTHVTCRGCNESYDVSERRAWLLQQAEDQLLTATECERALEPLVRALVGIRFTAAMIRGYARRDRLTPRPPHPHDPRHAPRYRVGEVVDVLTQVHAEGALTRGNRRAAIA